MQPHLSFAGMRIAYIDGMQRSSYCLRLVYIEIP